MTEKKNRKNPLTIPYILAIGIVVAAIMGYGLWRLLYGSYQGTTIAVIVPPGATEKIISDSIAKADSWFAKKVMIIWEIASGTPRRAEGYYILESGTNPIDFARKLKRGEQTPVKFTFNNIRKLDEFVTRAADKFAFTVDDVYAAMDSVLPAAGFRGRSEYPAAFLPDTYEFYWNVPAEKFISTLLAYRNRFWDDERRQLAADLGLNPVKVATVASIVEEESGKSDERPAIARLYLNRIKKGIPLQADPTVKFAIGDFSIRRITRDMLAVNSPYNTYKVQGLPPGPIRIPERKTLQQVLSAPEHPYLYMCAKEDFSGYHNFATTLEEHNRNAARYHRELNRRGIK